MGQFLDRSTRIATSASSQLHMPSAADVRDNAAWKACKPLLTGALAGMTATTFTQPLDTLKVRVQVAAASGKSVSPFTVASQTLRNEGALVFYKGLSAGLMRQVIYTGGRFGIFDTLIERSRDPTFDSVPGFAKKSFCAITAGGVAAAAGNPADLSLIRMQADSLLPAAQRRNYTGVVHAMATIARTEGVGGLFKGASLTSTRAMGSTFGTLAFNAQAKEMLQEAGAPGLAPVGRVPDLLCQDGPPGWHCTHHAGPDQRYVEGYGGLKLWTPRFMRNLHGRSSSYGRWSVDVFGTLMPRLVQCAWGGISSQRTRCGHGISDAQPCTDVHEKCL